MSDFDKLGFFCLRVSIDNLPHFNRGKRHIKSMSVWYMTTCGTSETMAEFIQFNDNFSRILNLTFLSFNDFEAKQDRLCLVTFYFG